VTLWDIYFLIVMIVLIYNFMLNEDLIKSHDIVD